MKLFYLKINPEELGKIPQDSSVIGFYNFAHPNSVYNIYFPKHEEKVIFPQGLNLGRGAKFTDFTAPAFLIHPYLVISKTFYKILTNFRLPAGRKEEIKLKKGLVEKDYIIFWAYDQHDSYLDYPLSEFELYDREEDRFNPIVKPIEINKLKDYLSLKESLGSDKRLICCNPIFNLAAIKEDLFLMPSSLNGVGYIVTEPLKKALEDAGLTGIILEEVV